MANNICVGLDISNTAVKVIALTMDRPQKLSGWGKVDLPSGINPLSEAPEHTAPVVESIKKLFSASKVQKDNVYLSLPESQVFSRIIEMPNLTERELSSAIKWEAEQYLPFPIKDVSITWEVVYRPENPAEKMKVFLVAAPLKIVNHFFDVCTHAGLKIASMESEGTASARIAAPPGSPVTLGVSLKEDGADFFVFREGKTTYSRSITTGARALTRALVAELGLNEAQAVEYRDAYGLLKDQMEGKIAATIAPVFELIVSEIGRTVALATATEPMFPVRRISLFGPGASLPGLTQYLTERLSLEAEITDPFVQVDAANIPSDLAKIRSIFVTPAGLALRS